MDSPQCPVSAVIVPSFRERRHTNGWYAAKKAEKCVYHKSLLTERSSAKRGEEEGKWCFLFALAFLLLFQIQNYKKVSSFF